MKSHIRTRIAFSLALAGCNVWEHTEYARLLDDALDAADVDLATALATPDHELRGTVLVGGALDPWTRTFEADLWNTRDLVVVELDLRGELVEIDVYDDDPWVRRAADLVAGSELSPYDAIAIAEDVVHDARAFAVSVDEPHYEVDVSAGLHIYRLWISPEDGDVVDLDDVSDHDCPCW